MVKQLAMVRMEALCLPASVSWLKINLAGSAHPTRCPDLVLRETWTALQHYDTDTTTDL